MNLIAVDSETHLIRPGMLTPRIVCGTFAQGAEVDIALRDQYLVALRSVLLDGDLILVGANIAYDFGCACAADSSLLPLVFAAYDAERVFDILIGAAMIDLAAGTLFQDLVTGRRFERYSQSLLEVRYLGIDRSAQKHAVEGEDSKPWRLRYAELDGVPLDQWPNDAYSYPLDDARLCLRVAEKEISLAENLTNMPEQARAAWALHLSAIWGMRTDPVMVAEVRARVEAEHARTLDRFTLLGIMHDVKGEVKVNGPELKRRVAVAYGASPTSRCAACAGACKVPSPKTGKPIQCKACSATGLDVSVGIPLSDTGLICADRDALAESGDEDLEAYAEAGANETLFKSFLPVLNQGLEVPINPETNVLVDTGRTSYRGALRQNFPRKGGIRDCFVPRPGFLFGSIDYGTLELCTLAQACIWITGGSEMARAINAGRDLHAQFGASVAGWTYEEMIERLAKHDPQAKDFRQLAKAPNFGLPGGLGAETLVQFARRSYRTKFCELSGSSAPGTCGTNKVFGKRSGRPICQDCLLVARRLSKLWFQEWPEVGEYHDAVKRLIEDGGQVQVPGPDDDWGLVRGGCTFTSGANNAFQGLAARGAKAALYEVTKECYLDSRSPMYGSRPVIFVHDEILIELPEERASEAAQRVSEVMVTTMRRFTPDVQIKAEPALMRRWLKGAEPVWKDGKLTPWEAA